MAWTVTLDAPVTPPSPAAPITVVTIGAVHYDNSRKRAWVTLSDLNMTLTLWTGAAYDAAGQWTDPDVVTRIKALATDGTLLKQYLATRPKSNA